MLPADADSPRGAMSPYIDWKTLFVSAEGRLSRNTFWIAAGILFALLIVYEAITGATLRLVTGWLVYPVLIYGGVCVLSKRLHDRGKSGWYAALIICALIGLWPYPDGPFDFLFLIVLIWGGVELGVLSGEQGANRYGPNPLRPVAA